MQSADKPESSSKERPAEATQNVALDQPENNILQLAADTESKEAADTESKEAMDKKQKKKEKEKEKKKEKEKEKKAKEKEKKAKEKEKEANEKEKEVKKKPNKQAELIREMLRRREEEERERQRLIEEEEKRLEAARIAREEEERLAIEKKEEAKRKKEEQILQQKKAGTFLSKKQRQAQEKAQRALFLNKDNNLPTFGSQDGEKSKKRYNGKVKKKTPATNKLQVDIAAENPFVPVNNDEKAKEDVTADNSSEELDDWEKIADMEEAIEAQIALGAAKKAKEVDPVVSIKQKAPNDGNIVAEPSTILNDRDDASDESSISEDESSDSSNDDASSMPSSSVRESKEAKFTKVRNILEKRKKAADAKKNPENLRSPVICVLGHVDTGKTKMLDNIRRTNIQDGEAGGITQQIGATLVPDKAIKERCRMVKDFSAEDVKIPGFLIIDTPGHESFANLRNRGSSLCDIAILVVDIMHGLEPQTIESLKLITKRSTPFVVALNKVDRLYNYESNPRKDIWQHLKAQPQNAQMEFKERYNKIVGEFAEQGINIELSYKNKDFDEYVSVVPTSAMNGDGIGNLMAHIVDQCQNRLVNRLMFSEELDCTVMEVRSLPGLGTTIDVILVNGTLKSGDAIVVTGTDGAIITAVKDLMMPGPLKDTRVKNEYVHYKEIRGAQGVKIMAKNLEKTVAGLPMFVANGTDELDVLKEDAEEQLSKALTSIKKKSEGVYVQASTLGSLEALLEFLKTQKIPYSNVNIGPVHKRDVQKAAAMLVHKSEFACILAFDVSVDREVQQLADKEGVRIFTADIIYHLEDSFLKYREELRLKRRKEHEHLAVYPCKLRVLPQHVFNARNPIVCGVSIFAGNLKKATPISAKTKDGCIFLGTVSSIEKNHDQVDMAKAGDEVCIKIDNTTGDAPKLYGRHFTHEDTLFSRISRESIDVCKTYFRDDLTKADWQLIIELKKWLEIM